MLRLALAANLLLVSLGAAAEPGAGEELHPCARPPLTLLSWSVGTAQADEDEDGGAGPLITDRPDFTESPTTVGRGRIQLEAGYTYTTDRSNGETFRSHSYPEILLRIGLFADWFELRVEQNVAGEALPAGSATGAEDLSLGCKLALTRQKGCWPETGLILAAALPTGHARFTNEQVMPEATYLYAWELIPDRLDLGGETQISRQRDDAEHYYEQIAQSATVGLALTDKLGSYLEWYAFFPTSAIAPDTTAEHYLNGGFTYLVNNNFQLDIRAGVGLNKHSDDFFTGAGFAYRY